MSRGLFFRAAFVAAFSVLVFSGQARRTSTTATQQRQAVQNLPTRPSTQRVTSPRQVMSPVTNQQAAASSVPTGTRPPVFADPLDMPSILLLPEDIQFPELPAGASSTVSLFGDPRNKELYVTRTFIPKGSQSIPHFHPDSRTITVLSGMCYYGRGEVFDENRTIPMPPGSFFTEPAGIPHYIWAKESDIVLQTTAVGPSGTQIVPAKTE